MSKIIFNCCRFAACREAHKKRQEDFSFKRSKKTGAHQKICRRLARGKKAHARCHGDTALPLPYAKRTATTEQTAKPPQRAAESHLNPSIACQPQPHSREKSERTPLNVKVKQRAGEWVSDGERESEREKARERKRETDRGREKEGLLAQHLQCFCALFAGAVQRLVAALADRVAQPLQWALLGGARAHLAARHIIRRRRPG